MGVQPITIPQSLAYVLNNAGDKSDVDFSYLLQTAQRESALNPTATTPSSSAVGLFQFLDSTWLQVMKQEGPRLGYQQYADAISTDKDGDYVIKDKKLRAEVLKLREDPQVAADMAAAFTQSNGQYLEQKFGRMPSPGELYIAHFLGPQGAEKMFNAGLSNPDQIAARLFPKQAKANPQIFYADGKARTVRDVYRALVSRHDGIVAADVQPDPKFLAQQLVNAEGQKLPTDELPSRFSKADMSFTALFATQAPTGLPQPLIGSEAAAPLIDAAALQPLALLPETPLPQSLVAIDAAVSDPLPGGFEPLPAPAPLLPPGEALALLPTELVPEPEDTGIPRARVLMTPRGGAQSSAFLTQIIGQR